MSSKKEIIIIGAGVCGCSTAYHLTKMGIAPLVIERDSIASRASGKAWGYMGGPDSAFLMQYMKKQFYGLSPAETGGVLPFIDIYQYNYHSLKGIAQDIKEQTGIDPAGIPQAVCCSKNDRHEREDTGRRRG